MFIYTEERLHDFSIKVGYSFSKVRFDASNYATCAEVAGHPAKGTSTSYTCRVPVIGQFVVVQIEGSSEILTLCEVRVFATAGKFTTVLLVASNILFGVWRRREKYPATNEHFLRWHGNSITVLQNRDKS